MFAPACRHTSVLYQINELIYYSLVNSDSIRPMSRHKLQGNSNQSMETFKLYYNLWKKSPLLNRYSPMIWSSEKSD